MENHTIASAIHTLRRFRAIAGTVIIVLLGGTVFYHFVEDLSWLNSIYLCVMTLATVGYGDFAPQTAAGKIFTIIYVLVGIGILGAFASNLLKTGMARKFLKQQDMEEIRTEMDVQGMKQRKRP
jgi:voltage-gated potassium channel